MLQLEFPSASFVKIQGGEEIPLRCLGEPCEQSGPINCTVVEVDSETAWSKGHSPLEVIREKHSEGPAPHQ